MENQLVAVEFAMRIRMSSIWVVQLAIGFCVGLFWLDPFRNMVRKEYTFNLIFADWYFKIGLTWETRRWLCSKASLFSLFGLLGYGIAISKYVEIPPYMVRFNLIET